MIKAKYLAGALLLLAAVIASYWALRSEQPQPTDSADKFIQADPFRVDVSIDPQQPRSGQNKIRIEVRDADNKPTTGAKVSAVGVMPSMGAMPEMRAPAELAETAPGIYAGEFELSMDGAWPLTVVIESNGERVQLGFDMTTSRRGLRLTSKPGMEMEAAGDGDILVDPRRRQAIGIRTGTVERRPFTVPLRLQGRITYDETRLADITLRFDGWIGELDADFEGKSVARGDILFTVYSPELLSLQDEYLQSAKRGGAVESGGALERAARKRLKLWGLSDRQIDWLGEQKSARDYVPIFAPRSGVVIEKNIVAGSAFKKGQRLLRLADLSQLWIEAFAYEQDLPLIAAGMQAQVELPNRYLPDFSAQVFQVNPFLQSETRSARVRLTLDNGSGNFQPGTLANLTLSATLGNLLLVPEDAVLIAGEKRFVFRDLGGGRLQPVRVRTGYSDGDHIVVRSGLSEGDKIITSGVFLIAAESRLKAGIEQW